MKYKRNPKAVARLVTHLEPLVIYHPKDGWFLHFSHEVDVHFGSYPDEIQSHCQCDVDDPVHQSHARLQAPGDAGVTMTAEEENSTYF